MNLINEEHVAFLKISEQRGDVSGLFDGWSGGRLEFRTHLVGDDVGERGLSQSWWTSQQHVIECFATCARGFHVNAQVLFDLPLADVVVDAGGTQREIELTVFVGCRAVPQFCGNWFSHPVLFISHSRASLRSPRRSTDSTVISPSSLSTLSTAFSAADLW